MTEKEFHEKLKAVVLDMDGVITRTAAVHQKAWKEMFDNYLQSRPENHEPMTEQDYIVYLDGKPRYKGVESFLKSRDIDLPYGSVEDAPGDETICGLGNRKNEIYTDLLRKKGAETYESAVQKVKEWRKSGLKTAVVTSSKNCSLVLETAGIRNLFDVQVDGNIANQQNLKGKPDPDIFLEATRRLEVSPRNCILFEDAVAGVQSGSNGNFAVVIGVARNNSKEELNLNGADLSIEDFDEIDLYNDEDIRNHFMDDVPLFLTPEFDVKGMLEEKQPVLFFDYDGTLTPIVKHPEDAVLDKQMKRLLEQCARQFAVAVVSGRDMDDLKNKVGLENVVYAGSHGFRISGPDGLYKEHEKTKEFLPKLDAMEKQLEKELNNIDPNVRIDRKRYAIAVHYRNVKEENVQEVLEHVDHVIKTNKGFKPGKGKKVIEIKPDVDWHKGKAVNWILEKLEKSNREHYIPIYIGDDVTDEDAFRSLKDGGVGILVGAHGDPSDARYRLKNVYQVRQFLRKILNTG